MASIDDFNMHFFKYCTYLWEDKDSVVAFFEYF